MNLVLYNGRYLASLFAASVFLFSLSNMANDKISTDLDAESRVEKHVLGAISELAKRANAISEEQYDDIRAGVKSSQPRKEELVEILSKVEWDNTIPDLFYARFAETRLVLLANKSKLISFYKSDDNRQAGSDRVVFKYALEAVANYGIVRPTLAGVYADFILTAINWPPLANSAIFWPVPASKDELLRQLKIELATKEQALADSHLMLEAALNSVSGGPASVAHLAAASFFIGGALAVPAMINNSSWRKRKRAEIRLAHTQWELKTRERVAAIRAEIESYEGKH